MLFIHAYIFVVWVSGSTETCTFPVDAVVPSVYVTSIFGSTDGEADGTGVEATDDSGLTVDEAYAEEVKADAEENDTAELENDATDKNVEDESVEDSGAVDEASEETARAVEDKAILLADSEAVTLRVADCCALEDNETLLSTEETPWLERDVVPTIDAVDEDAATGALEVTLETVSCELEEAWTLIVDIEVAVAGTLDDNDGAEPLADTAALDDTDVSSLLIWLGVLALDALPDDAADSVECVLISAEELILAVEEVFASVELESGLSDEADTPVELAVLLVATWLTGVLVTELAALDATDKILLSVEITAEEDRTTVV